MRLSAQIVYFIRRHLAHYASQVRGISQIAVVENQLPVINMWSLVQVVNALRIKLRRTALYTVYLVTLTQKELCKVSAILARNTGD